MGIKYLALTGVAMGGVVRSCETATLTRLHAGCRLPRHATQRVLQPGGNRAFTARRVEGRDSGGTGRPASNGRTLGRNATADSPAAREFGFHRSRPGHSNTSWPLARGQPFEIGFWPSARRYRVP